MLSGRAVLTLVEATYILSTSQSPKEGKCSPVVPNTWTVIDRSMAMLVWLHRMSVCSPCDHFEFVILEVARKPKKCGTRGVVQPEFSYSAWFPSKVSVVASRRALFCL